MGTEHELLKEEHTEILGSLQAISSSGGNLAGIFSDMTRIFSYHVDREEEIMVPLLDYLAERHGNISSHDMGYLEKRSAEFQIEMENLLREHEHLMLLIEVAERVLKPEDEVAVAILSQLRKHTLLEDDLLYPAAQGAVSLIEIERSRLQTDLTLEKKQ